MLEAAPHVVVLVDNYIDGDSRVQKTATSMAERGWRVTLVGRRPAGAPRRRQIGGVPAIGVTITSRAAAPARADRPVWYRSPLAYRSRSKQLHRVGMSEAAVVKRRYAIDVAKVDGRDSGARRYLLRGRMVLAEKRRGLVEMRSRSTDALRSRRTLRTGMPDRVATRLWQAVLGDSAWERLDSGIWDWEFAYAPVLDRLRPDLIHANDHRMLAIATRAAARAEAQGRSMKVIWDAHELLEGLETSAATPVTWTAAQKSLEHAHAPRADAVISVSQRISEVLQQQHGLDACPGVVLNAPITVDVVEPDVSLRKAAGVDDDTPLLVYSGSLSRERSVITVVEALPSVPELHFVLVVGSPKHPLVVEALTLATELGVSDRVHTAPYVPINSIVPYLAGADVGVHPILHGLNTESSLPTKYFEYAQARLPVVVSDVETMAATTRATGTGEVFTAGDPESLASALRTVLADLPRYRKAFDADLLASWTWEAQAQVLDDLYRDVVGRGPATT